MLLWSFLLPNTTYYMLRKVKAANTVWFPKGSQWIGRVPPSIQSCFYDADALYLKRDVAGRSGSEGEAALVGLTHEHEARQLPIRLANKGNRVILVAGSY